MKVSITKFDHFGRGIGRINDKIIFVNKALPNEVVDVNISNTKKNYLEGNIKKIIKENSSRIKPICPYYDSCGGCDFLHTTYDEEKKFKVNKSQELLNRCDSFYETKELNYRNKVTLHVKNNEIGLYQEKSKDIVNIDYCYLLDDMINKVIHDLNQVDWKNIRATRVIIKANQNRLLLDIDSNINNDFINKIDYVDTIISNNKMIKGEGFIEEVIDNKVFKITSNAFFQVNKKGLESINKIIKDFLKDKQIIRALDLYSGTSIWSILISEYVKNVTSIEINMEACLNAKDNIKKNNIENVKVINGDVKDYIDQFNNIDLVIVDPPRSGLDKKTRDYLKIINSKYFVYISCDMQTLKRDLKELEEIYQVDEIDLVDMFKRTYHVECVCFLSRKE